MGLAVPETRVAAEGERGVNRLSLRWITSWSMRLSVKRVFSLLPEAKQSIARREAEVTVQQVTSHCTPCCTSRDRYETVQNMTVWQRTRGGDSGGRGSN